MIKYFTGIIHALKTVLIGMSVTVKYLFTKPVTMQYPDERWTMPERFRGMVKAEPEQCISCQYCVNICPVSCIILESAKIDVPVKITNKEGKEVKRLKDVSKFDIDISRCVYCGFCAEGCPTGAIYMSHDYETSCRSREEMIYHWTHK